MRTLTTPWQALMIRRLSSAAQFEVPDESLVIVFCSTDGSMTRWHENMKMLYMDALSCQQRARKYLECVAEQFTAIEKYLDKKSV